MKGSYTLYHDAMHKVKIHCLAFCGYQKQ